MSVENPVVLAFTRPPALLPAYASALLSRRPALVPADTTLGRIEASLDRCVISAADIERFSRVAGGAPDLRCPLTLPHVAALPLQLAVLTHGAFPVQLRGIVHVENEIQQRRWLAAGEPLSMRASVEGFDDTPRGHEFVLETEARSNGELVWREASRLLARRPRREAGAALHGERGSVESSMEAAVTTWDCDRAIGRRYARLSGDYNPIHLSAFTAKLFGFDRAIAHGMWTLSKIAEALGSGYSTGAVKLCVRFRAPVKLPARVQLRTSREGPLTRLRVLGSDGTRLHVEGTLEAATS